MTDPRRWRRVRAWNAIPLREPWRLLVPLLVVHWLALVVFTARVNHNGWLFYQGGDQIWFWTTSWLLGHGSITVPNVSHGWPLLLVPFTWIGGAGFLGGLPGRCCSRLSSSRQSRCGACSSWARASAAA